MIDQMLDDALAGRDPHDYFPWSWSAWVDDDGNNCDVGAITTPNGQRPDGAAHTYWMIAGDVWEPVGRLVCHMINGRAAIRFGTPMPATAAR